MRHKVYKNLPSAAGCGFSDLSSEERSACMKSKHEKLYIPNPKKFVNILENLLRRESGIQRFLSIHGLPYLFITYEDLTTSDDIVRTNAWCSVEEYLKKRICQSACAKIYLGESLNCGNSSWCTSFAEKFKSATPLRNHTD